MKSDDGEYMSFGLSPDRSKTFMVGADVAVAWIDEKTGKGYAEDYFLDAKSQCSGNRGSCPDTRLGVSDTTFISFEFQKWWKIHLKFNLFSFQFEPGQNQFNSCIECCNGERLLDCNISATVESYR